MRTIRWTAEGGFDDPTGLVDATIRSGDEVRLPPVGPTSPAGATPDLAVLLTAWSVFDEILDETFVGEVTVAEIPPGAVA